MNMRVLGRFLALAVVAVGAVSAHAQLQGTLQQVTFPGPVTGGPVSFSIYLPQGYAQGTDDLPVVYHFHGLGGSHLGGQLNTLSSSYESARAAGLIGPAIIVFANGYTNSFWANSANSNKPAETNVVQELIPYVDAHYRTIADRAGRVSHGFSMGGFGASKFASKFPELFGVCVNYDGAMLTWDRMVQFQSAIASEIFDNDEAYFDDYSPWRWSTENAKPLGANAAFRTVVGALVDGNRQFRDHLQELGIAVNYVETGQPHDLGAMLGVQGAQSWAFIAANLSGTAPVCRADWDGSGVVNSTDVSAFINAWFLDQRFGTLVTDINLDGIANSVDVGEFVNRWFEDLAAGCGV